VGFYVSVYGLGKNPRDTTITKLHAENGNSDISGALCNFWRSAENVKVTQPTTNWAVS
jgi:hypothetical protein